MKKIFIWIAILVLGFIFAKFTSPQTIVFTSNSLTLVENDYIGKYDFIKFFPKKSFWITNIDYEVVGAERETIHHVILENLSKPDYTCPNVFKERIHANGKEISPLVLPKGYGYPINRTDGIAVINHLINPTQKKLDDIKIRFTFKTKPKNFFSQLTPVQPIWVDVKNCTNDPTFYVPPKTNQTLTIEPKVYVPNDGKVVYIGGHLHNYGKEITIKISDVDYKIIPEPNFTNIEKIPHFTYENNQQIVRKGDLIDFYAEYDNQSNSEIDGMGIGMIYISK